MMLLNQWGKKVRLENECASAQSSNITIYILVTFYVLYVRSEERRVGKEGLDSCSACALPCH